MEKRLNQLRAILTEVQDIGQATGILGWDQQVNMPPGGTEDRGEVLATLSRIAHDRFTADEVGKLLDELQPYADQLDAEADDKAMLREVRRAYEHETKVPADKVAEWSRVTSVSHEAWVKARQSDDFSIFQPHLEKIFALRREYVDYFKPYDHVYDPLLDIYEPGMKTADVKAIFSALRPQQVELIKAIASRPQVNDSFLHQEFPEKTQLDFGVNVITRMGYDWNRGRQDKAPHPFCSGFNIGDVRITTRFDPKFLNPALFGTMHEAGHALYEQGISPAYNRTPLGGTSSLAVHESQSRMWENLVGRSRPFWVFHYPLLQETYPTQFANISLDTFFKGINKVEPSLIRVEADEATYNLHIMLRLEIEIALMEGSLAVKDLPEVWNTRMHEYLGITPPNNSLGVLQDIHWSMGLIGYFATYALGNLVSAQLWECIVRDIPNLEEQIMQGEFKYLLGWLREHIHRFGSKYQPMDLIQRATGSKIDAAPYMRYLTRKFSAIYG
jgi:carboxypeptidase Taq